MSTARIRIGTGLAATALVLSACSSSGGGGSSVSTSQLEGKLRKDPTITSLKSQLNNNAKAYNALVTCAAKAIKKEVDGGKVKDYVDGKISIEKLGTKAQGQKVGSEVETCAKNALGVK